MALLLTIGQVLGGIGSAAGTQPLKWNLFFTGACVTAVVAAGLGLWLILGGRKNRGEMDASEKPANVAFGGVINAAGDDQSWRNIQVGGSSEVSRPPTRRPVHLTTDQLLALSQEMSRVSQEWAEHHAEAERKRAEVQAKYAFRPSDSDSKRERRWRQRRVEEDRISAEETALFERDYEGRVAEQVRVAADNGFSDDAVTSYATGPRWLLMQHTPSGLASLAEQIRLSKATGSSTTMET